MRFDGFDGAELEGLLGVPCVVVRDRVTSTLDVAHQLAAGGAPAGTLVVADSQTAGRGRMGRSWESPPGAGLWLTLLLRPSAAPAPGALSLRAGLAVVDAVASVAAALSPRLKWPNDVMVRGRKAAGILCEARWSGEVINWVAVGVGVNVRGPVPDAVAAGAVALAEVSPEVTRLSLLAAIVPRLRAAGDGPPELVASEQARFAAMAWPSPGEEIVGLAPDGALLLRGPGGAVVRRATP